MATRDSLDHDVLAPFSSRMSRSRFNRAAENIAFGHGDFAGTLKQWTNSSAIAPIYCCAVQNGSALPTPQTPAVCIGQWLSRAK